MNQFMPQMTTMKVPAEVGGISVRGFTLQPDKQGFVDVPAECVEECESHGLVQAQRPQMAPRKSQQAAKVVAAPVDETEEDNTGEQEEDYVLPTDLRDVAQIGDKVSVKFNDDDELLVGIVQKVHKAKMEVLSDADSETYQVPLADIERIEKVAEGEGEAE